MSVTPRPVWSFRTCATDGRLRSGIELEVKERDGVICSDGRSGARRLHAVLGGGFDWKTLTLNLHGLGMNENTRCIN